MHTSLPPFFLLAVHLRRSDLEWAAFSDLTPLEFIAQRRRTHDIGWKHAAVALNTAANLEVGQSRGNGNRAAKRAAVIETNAWFDHVSQLSDLDIDEMAEEFEHRDTLRLSYHE